MRRRGIGGALVIAARKAAHTRGARRLYALDGDGIGYLDRFGFERVTPSEMIDDLAGTFIAGYIGSRPEAFAQLAAMRLDISRDGVIER
jgi:N-acetylglutamate synthase-like GNAT family acetyltransferase